LLNPLRQSRDVRNALKINFNIHQVQNQTHINHIEQEQLFIM
jgi:hypothetical protein